MLKPSTKETKQSNRLELSKALLLMMFGASGMAALIYQIAWQRILALHSGVGIFSIAIIVSAFMTGLGIGSYWGGFLVVRVKRANLLLWFMGFELAIGAWALSSIDFYYSLLGSYAPWLYKSLWITGITHFLSLLPPTCLMGMSLPFLAQSAISDIRMASRTVSLLYGINILGASLGALITPWILMRYYGVQGAIYAGVMANFSAGFMALLVWKLRDAPQPVLDFAASREIPVGVIEKNPATESRFRLWLLLFAMSGFFALALEMIWFRLIEVSVRSTAFTFGSVLSIYLLGLAAGCLFGGRWTRNVESPLRAFLLIQSIILIYAGIAVILLIGLPANTPIYEELVRYWKSSEVFELGTSWNTGRIFGLYIGLPLMLYGPPTVLMGVSFELLQRAVHDDVLLAGQRVGFLQAMNVIGNILGSLIVSLLLIQCFGTPLSLRFLILLGLMFPILGWWLERDRRQVAAGLMIGLLFLFWPSTNAFWARLHGVTTENNVGKYAEDASGLMAITPAADEFGAFRVSMNGKWQSWLPFGGIHSELGAIAAILHPNPKSIAIVGLGSGDTAWAAGCRSETESITVFEICSAEKQLLESVSQDYPQLDRFLSDPRVKIFAEDGRRFLSVTSQKFDLIEADALRPQSALAGNIYSVEFFRICSARLNPGGMMCQWAPTIRTYYTFLKVFPYVAIIPSQSILIGSNDPFDLNTLLQQGFIDRQDVATYLGDSIHQALKQCTNNMGMLQLQGENPLSPNHDLFPRDEFVTP